MILLENVKGFETSQACLALINVLEECGYKYQVRPKIALWFIIVKKPSEALFPFLQRFLLSPLQFGISNARLRFYLIARLDGAFPFDAKEDIHVMPLRGIPLPQCDCPVCEERLPDVAVPSSNFEEFLPLCGLVLDYLDSKSAEQEASKLQMPDKELRRGFKALDIVGPDSRRTCCFTKRYTQFLEGTGSLLQTCAEAKAKEFLDTYRQHEEDAEALFSYAKSLQLRFFSSREIANFMSFPKSFGESSPSLSEHLFE